MNSLQVGKKYTTSHGHYAHPGYELLYHGPKFECFGIFDVYFDGKLESSKLILYLGDEYGMDASWKLVPERDNTQWIVWGPSGRTNPRVVFIGQTEAEKAADNMTKLHKQVFYAAQLVTKFEPKVTVESIRTEVSA